MSNVKYLEMDDIAYKEWSHHLDFVASSRASPWLPAYGCHVPSPSQEIYEIQSDAFVTDNPSVNQQQYLVLETILEETSDDLCSESDKSGPTGWNSDSDADSVIHITKSSENTENWKSHDYIGDVPKKRRRRIVDKFSASDDDEPQEFESTSLSSRSSSLIAFESLEKHCEDVFVTTASNEPFGCGSSFDTSNWITRSLDSARESLKEMESSDDDQELSSSVDTLHRSYSLRNTFKSRASNDSRIKSYRSFDSLNLLESSPPVSYTLAELSQSHSALDYEKIKQQEQKSVIRDKKLTETTADLTIMSDPYDRGFKNFRISPYRRQDTASFHYKGSPPFRNVNPALKDFEKNLNSPKRKSYGSEVLKQKHRPVEVYPGDSIQECNEKSEQCLNVPHISHPSAENLSEDSGFDDHMSAKSKMNFINFGNSVSSIPEDENTSPLQSSPSVSSSSSSTSNFSDCNESEEGSLESGEGREESKVLNKNIGYSKITNKKEANSRGSCFDGDDVKVKFNLGYSQTHMFSRTGEKESLFQQRNVENLIATDSVPFLSLSGKQFDDAPRICDNYLKGSKFQSFHGEKSYPFNKSAEELLGTESVVYSLKDFTCDKMSDMKFEKNAGGMGKTKTSRLPVLSTPNLYVRDDDFILKTPSTACSLTQVPLNDDNDMIDSTEINGFSIIENKLNSEFCGSHTSSGSKGVHFCPIVSEVSWQDNNSENSSQTSSDQIKEEISNRSFEELCKMKNDEEDFGEIEEKLIPRDRNHVYKITEPTNGKLSQEKAVADFKEKDWDLLNMIRVNSTIEGNGSGTDIERKNDFTGSIEKPVIIDENVSKVYKTNTLPKDYEAYVKEKPVTPTNSATPTSCGHVLVSDAAQPDAERKTWLSVSESNLPMYDYSSDHCFESDGRASTDNISALGKEITMKKSKSRLGGFFERFSLRRLSNRKGSGGGSKKRNDRKEEKREKDKNGGASSNYVGVCEDVMIIPLHGPENEAEVKEIFRSVVTPHVVSAKPPLPPNLQRMPGGLRKRSPYSGTVSVGLQDDEEYDKESMPGIRNNILTNNEFQNSLLINSPCNGEPKNSVFDKPIGLLETDLDTHITVESAGRRPLSQSNVGSNKKARSLMNLGLGDMSIHPDQHQNISPGYLEPQAHRNHGSVAVDDRAKSMEFLLDKENQASVLPPENELQKGTGERVMSEHQLRVQRSLQKLNVPDWYKCSAVSQTPQGFLLKRNSESRRDRPGWPGLGSKTTSLSSLGSSYSATAQSSAGPVSTPSPHLFTRWSTSRLNSGFNSSSTSPSGSVRSSFNYRQPYLGWRSQERLTKPRTPAERLAAGLLPLQKQQHTAQSNSQSSINLNLSDVRTSIKEVTSAIVHYVSGVQENGLKETPRTHNFRASPSNSPKWQASPKGSTGRLCWLESSFVGSRPLDLPETPLSLTEASAVKSEPGANELHLNLTSNSELNQVNSHRLNEGTSTKTTFEVRKRPSPTSTTLDDILDSLLGLPPTSRSPSPGRSRPIPPLPDVQHQKPSCSDIRANVSESASDPGNAFFVKEVKNSWRKSDGNFESGLKRQMSSERLSKISAENNQPSNNDTNKKEHYSHLTDTMVKCRYSKCGKTATILDAKRTFKTCHNCSHVYCSRECRRAHWERHKRTCLHSRMGALCKQVLVTAKDDVKVLHHLSMLARRGYLTHGRGAVKIFFSSPESAEKFVSRGFDELGEPAYVKWSDLLPAEMGADLFAELMKICKSYNPNTRLVLYVAVCVVSEVPTTGAVKWERQLVSRCCKIPLEKSLQQPKEDKQVPPPLPPRKSLSDCVKITRDMENPDTLILTSLPGITGKIPERKNREISFVNIQRELKQRGVNLRRQFPEVYHKLCSYVEGTSEHFTPVTIYPRDIVSGKSFMCIIMPESEPEKLELVPKDSNRVKTIDIGVEHKVV